MPFRRLHLVFVLGLINSRCRAQTCDHVDQVLTMHQRSTYSSLIVATPNRPTFCDCPPCFSKPSQVGIAFRSLLK